ncbi:MAG TPA: T9SS type A sorting domain-containing protein, partial [Candidatus Kapabacteria bacterium]|nr:T9SS type A sorting domain-containing protein [Candidatus Kapabacteria bacterium]
HTWLLKPDNKNPCQNQFLSNFSLSSSIKVNGSVFNSEGCEHAIMFSCDTVPIFPLPADINPPLFENGKSGNHIYTIHVHDAQVLDSGLKSITWATSADLSNFIITIDPPIKLCAMDKDDHLVTITQLDSLAEGCIRFTFTDCAGNQNDDIICIPSALRVVTLPTVIDFGNVHIDSTTQKIVNVANPQSNIAVTIDSIYIDKATGPVFQLLAPPVTPLQLTGNGTLPFTMQYLPTKVAADTGRLEITYHADNIVKKSLSIPMKGSGINPAAVNLETSSAILVEVSPNPFTKETRISISTEEQLGSVELIDVTGKSIKLPLSKTIVLHSAEMGLQSGVYMLKVSNGKESVLQKIIKE